MANGRPLADEATLGQLVASASRDMSTLLRSEIQLAKSEIRVDVMRAAKGGALFGIAGVLSGLAVILLSIAAAYGLTALGLHPGWAFLIVAGAYLLIAGLAGLIGILVVKRVGPPERTIRTTKDSVAALRHRNGSRPDHLPAIESSTRR